MQLGRVDLSQAARCHISENPGFRTGCAFGHDLRPCVLVAGMTCDIQSDCVGFCGIRSKHMHLLEKHHLMLRALAALRATPPVLELDPEQA